jgi:hypothetical protein
MGCWVVDLSDILPAGRRDAGNLLDPGAQKMKAEVQTVGEKFRSGRLAKGARIALQGVRVDQVTSTALRALISSAQPIPPARLQRNERVKIRVGSGVGGSHKAHGRPE